MSMYVNGDRDKVKKVAELAKKLGLEPLYHEENVHPSLIFSVHKTTDTLMESINDSVALMTRACEALKGPVSPSDITGHGGRYRDTVELGRYLNLAYLKRMVDRKPVKVGNRNSYVYSPKSSVRS